MFVKIILFIMLGFLSNALRAEGKSLQLDAPFAQVTNHSGTGVLASPQRRNSTVYSVLSLTPQDYEVRAAVQGRRLGNFEIAVGINELPYDMEEAAPHYLRHEGRMNLESAKPLNRLLMNSGLTLRRGAITKQFGNVVIGLGGERRIGGGPLLGYSFSSTSRVSLMVPLIKRRSEHEGGVKAQVTWTAIF